MNEKLKKVFFFVLRFMIAGGIIFWLIKNSKDDVLRELKDYNFFWLIPAAVMYLGHLVFSAWRWRELLKIQNINLSLFEAFSLTMKSFFLSLVIPGGAFGGDLAKIAFVSARAPEGQKVEGAFSILVDRITGMIALFGTTLIFCFICLPLLFSLHEKKPSDGIFILILLIVCLVGLCAGVGVFFHRIFEKIGLFKKIIDFVDKKTHGTVKRIFNALDLYRSSYKSLLLMTFYSMLMIHLLLSLVMFLVILGLEGNVNVSILYVITGILLGNVAGVIPLTPAGLGFRDYIIKLIFAAGGMAHGAELAPVLIYSSLIVCFNVLGGIFFVFKFERKDQENLIETP